MKNIELFNLSVANVFGKCYQSFPVPIELYSGIVASEVEQKYKNEMFALTDGHSAEHQISDSTIQWLIDSGYIKGSKKIGFNVYENVVLTPMGLIALNAMPDSLKENNSTTIGDKLIDFSGDCTISFISELAKIAISEGAKLITG